MDQLYADLRALERRLNDTSREYDRKLATESKNRAAGDAESRRFAGDLLARALDMEIYAAAFILVGVVAANLVPLMC